MNFNINLKFPYTILTSIAVGVDEHSLSLKHTHTLFYLALAVCASTFLQNFISSCTVISYLLLWPNPLEPYKSCFKISLRRLILHPVCFPGYPWNSYLCKPDLCSLLTFPMTQLSWIYILYLFLRLLLTFMKFPSTHYTTESFPMVASMIQPK